MRNKALDIQVGGNHYKKDGMQPMELADKVAMLPSCFSIFKYVYRHKDKNGREDLNKALHCCSIKEELKSDWYNGCFTTDVFRNFLSSNPHLDSNQRLAILAIQVKNMDMLRWAINKEINDCYGRGESKGKGDD